MAHATPTPKRTALYGLHLELGAKMVPFAGWELPLRYGPGILAEHLHTRDEASLFDVSHMGQIVLRGERVAAALEALVPGDIAALAPGRMRYTQFTNETGGILDDLMVVNAGDHLFLVVNASRRDDDLALLRGAMGADAELLDDRALLALQGPASVEVLAELAPACRDLAFLSGARMDVDGTDCFVTRSGYTGEDGFEISAPADAAEALARRLLAHPSVAPAGLGARDSLRLEAGLCLHGHDIDERTTPVEAGLGWSIGHRRLREGGFPGAKIIGRQLAEGAARRRVGIRPLDKALARENTEIRNGAGEAIGHVTSGLYGPSVGGPISMGYVEAAHAEPGHALSLIVRGKPHDAKVTALPFVAPRYHRV